MIISYFYCGGYFDLWNEAMLLHLERIMKTHRAMQRKVKQISYLRLKVIVFVISIFVLLIDCMMKI